MIDYTEVYNQGLAVKDISSSRYYYLAECSGCKHKKVLNRNKYHFLRKYQKQHYEYIVYNPDNIGVH